MKLKKIFILILIFLTHNIMSAQQETILITGGAGYIGSAVAYYLSKSYKIIVIDNLKYNQKFEHKWAELIVGDYSDEKILENIITKNKIHAVVHCAASIEVGLSVKHPSEFYYNNVLKTIKLLDILVKNNIKKIIFSSSCAVYGIPKFLPLTEDHPKDPISPYGNTKLTIEFILNDYQKAYDLNYIALRYFNACGAILEQNLGEIHEPETHLIPLVIDSIFKNKKFNVFGDDYNTPDGTCIRDYLHIKDIAIAHEKALNYLDKHNRSLKINLGTGQGYSVNQIIASVEKYLNKKVDVNFSARREGDPAILVANPELSHNLLGWKAQHSTLKEIVKDACEFYKNNILPKL